MSDHFFIGAGIILVIACLIVRDRTEYEITRLRAECMALRNDIELMVAQANDALMRADRHCSSLRKGCEIAAALTVQLEILADE